MSITVSVQGQNGPNVVATNGDTILLGVSNAPAPYGITVSPAGTPGGIGPQGPQGPPSTTITVGNVSTLAPGSNATVTSSSSNNGANLTLDFGIPSSSPPTIQIGNVTTGAAGSSACVTATPANGGQLVTLDLTIPRGDPGSNGSNGTNLTLSDATPSALGTASAGTSSLVSRADHAHQLPVIAYGNLSGVPSNFPTNTTLVSGLSAGYAAINHAHEYVTSLNNLTGALTLAAGSNVTLTANGSTLTLASAGGGIGANDAIDGGDYVGEIVYAGSITITQQPSNQTAVAGAATFSAAATVSPTGNISYQWQKSDNAGATWVSIGGATASSIALSNLTYDSDNGDMYRVVVSAPVAASATSASALLTVSDTWSGTGVVSSKWTTTTNFLEKTFTSPAAGTLYIDFDYTVNFDTGFATGFGVFKNNVRVFGAGSDSSQSGSINSSVWTTFAAGDSIKVRRETVVNGSSALDTAGHRTINSMTLWIA